MNDVKEVLPPWVEFPNIPIEDPRYVGDASVEYGRWLDYVCSMDRSNRISYFARYGVPEDWLLCAIELIAGFGSPDEDDAAMEELMIAMQKRT